MANSGGRIFISYRRTESRHLAGRLSDRLTVQFGQNSVFMDVDTLQPGADFEQAIIQAVGSCHVLVAIIGPAWASATDRKGSRRLGDASDYVTLEIQAALDRNIIVIPVLVDEAEIPGVDELPLSLHRLARRNAVRLDHETFSTDINRIIDAITQVLAGVLRVPPAYRVVFRIGLWCIAFMVAILAAVPIGITIEYPTINNLSNATVTVLLLLSVEAGILLLLRREIKAERRLHAEARSERVRKVSERALSERHVRHVAVALGFTFPAFLLFLVILSSL